MIQNYLEILNDVSIELKEFWCDDNYLLCFDLEIVEDKDTKFFDVKYVQETEKYVFTTTYPEDIRNISLKVKNAPDWACKKYDVKVIENDLAFIRNDSGNVRLPRNMTEARLSSILNMKCYIFTRLEFVESYGHLEKV